MQQYQTCIDACNKCMQACEECLSLCLKEPFALYPKHLDV
ncbi:four-helix bundle copper-binding protein [Cohnella luojiensis]|nr:four-helix bundle copper-binding protein [Cohnella luojiensis]